MNQSEKITTPIASMEYIDGILFSDFLNKDITLEGAKEHVALQYKHFSQHYPILSLSDITKMKQSNKAVRDYFASPELAKDVKAAALITGSGIAKIAGNLYLQFSKPKYPLKMFTSKESALEWLNSLR